MNIWIRRSLQVGTVSAGIVLAGTAAAQAQTLDQHSGLTTEKAGIVNQAAKASGGDTDPGIPAGAKPSGGNASNAQQPANDGRPAGVNSDYSTTPAGQAQAPETETEAPATNPAPAANPAPATNPAPAANPAPANNGAPVAGNPTGGNPVVGNPVGGGNVLVRPVQRTIIVVDDDDDDDFGFIGGGPRFRGGWDRWDRWDNCGGGHRHRWDCDRFERRHHCGFRRL